jgi:hypothetical protein
MNEQDLPELMPFDADFGTVIGHCGRRSIILLDNGHQVCAYHGAKNGSRVLCGVKRLSDPDHCRDPIVVVESIFVAANAEKGSVA